MAASEGLSIETAEDGVRLITLDRADKRNALGRDLVDELADALSQASGVSAVVLTGAGETFCSGGDLVEISGVAATGALAALELVYASFHRLVRTFDEVGPPIIAAMNGDALGAGLDLALCCDLRIAAEEAVLASSWIHMGLVPGMGGASRLVQLLGAARASELVLLGDRISAATALEWGLVNSTAPRSEVVPRALAMAAKIARLPRPAIRQSRAALRRASASIAPELAILGPTQGVLLSHSDFADAARRFRSRSSHQLNAERPAPGG